MCVVICGLCVLILCSGWLSWLMVVGLIMVCCCL